MLRGGLVWAPIRPDPLAVPGHQALGAIVRGKHDHRSVIACHPSTGVEETAKKAAARHPPWPATIVVDAGLIAATASAALLNAQVATGATGDDALRPSGHGIPCQYAR